MSQKSLTVRAEESKERDEMIKYLLHQQSRFIIALGRLLWEQKKNHNYRLVLGDPNATWTDYCNWELRRDPDYCTVLVRIYEHLVNRLNLPEDLLQNVPQRKLYRLTQYAESRGQQVHGLTVKAEIKEILEKAGSYSRQDFDEAFSRIMKGQTINEIENCEHVDEQGQNTFEALIYEKCTQCGQRQGHRKYHPQNRDRGARLLQEHDRDSAYGSADREVRDSDEYAIGETTEDRGGTEDAEE